MLSLRYCQLPFIRYLLGWFAGVDYVMQVTLRPTSKHALAWAIACVVCMLGIHAMLKMLPFNISCWYLIFLLVFFCIVVIDTSVILLLLLLFVFIICTQVIIFVETVNIVAMVSGVIFVVNVFIVVYFVPVLICFV